LIVFIKTGVTMKKQYITTVGSMVLGGILTLQFVPIGQAQIGPSTSYGSHPYESYSGDITSSSTNIMVAPSDNAFLLTDVIITQTESTSGFCGGLILFYADSTPIGHFRIASSVDGNAGWGQGLISHAFAGGLPIDAGQTLSVQSQNFFCANISYTVSGRYIQP
jgi:hypothetical protein